MSEEIRPLVVLPNHDLWRGHVYNPVPRQNVEMSADMPRPFAKIDEAMASILKAAAGAQTLTCIWCGFQSDDKSMRGHLTSNHASVVEPPTNEQLLLASNLNKVAADAVKTEE